MLGEWIHLTGRKTTTEIEICVNVVFESGNPFGTGSVSNSLNLEIGRQTFEESGYFTGLIDDIKVFNRALTGEEIQAVADPCIEDFNEIPIALCQDLETILGYYEKPDLASLGLEGATARDPLAVLRQAELVDEQLQRDDL